MTSSIFGITYGPSGAGKTLAMIRAFPNGFFIAPPGALLCGQHLGWMPKGSEFSSILETAELIKREHKKYPAIIVDDLSLLADQEMVDIRKKFAGWSANSEFNRRMSILRDAARYAECHVFFTMHERSPREVKQDNNVRYIPGSPLIPGWEMAEKLPAMCDFVARVVYDETVPWPWPYVYQTGPDQHYVTKDRLGLSPYKFPMNLRALLKASGTVIPRPKELQWMDKIVDQLAPVLVPLLDEPDELKTLLTKAASKLSKHKPEHVIWCLTDSVDEAQLLKHESTKVESFINNCSLGETNVL
jgi:hypothetical protein